MQAELTHDGTDLHVYGMANSRESTTSNNIDNKGLTPVSSSKDDIRDAPAVYITTNRFNLTV